MLVKRSFLVPILLAVYRRIRFLAGGVWLALSLLYVLASLNPANAITVAGVDCEYQLDERTDSYASCSGPNRSGFASIPLGEVGVSAYGTDYDDGTFNEGTVDAAFRTNIFVVNPLIDPTGSYDLRVTGSFAGVGGSSLVARLGLTAINETGVDEVAIQQKLNYDGTNVTFESPERFGLGDPLGDVTVTVLSSDPTAIDFLIHGAVTASTLNNRVSLLVGLHAVGSASELGTSSVDFSNTATLRISGIEFTSETGELFQDQLPPSTVPIPAALPLLLSALGVFGFFGWRRTRMAAD